MKNIGIQRVLTDTPENFTSNVGIKIRRFITPPLRLILKIATKRKIHLESYPELDKKDPYIFVSTHFHEEDIISSLACIDRPAYILIGSTDQIRYNPQLYAAWANGLIYVDRLDSQSRKDALLKMERILKSGTSVLIFVEGALNNSENALVNNLFASPYILSQNTGAKVVPIGNFNEFGSKDIYINFANPIDMTNMSKEDALTQLRDTMATMLYNSIEEHATPLVRSELPSDCRIKYMEQRKKVFNSVKWKNPCWDEELLYRHDKNNPSPEDVWRSFENVKITPENEEVMAPILELSDDYKKHDFKAYMKKYWNKR